MAKQTVRLTPNNDVVNFLGKSQERVAQLPEWKRGVLEVSSSTSNTVARTTVTTNVEGAATSSAATDSSNR